MIRIKLKTRFPLARSGIGRLNRISVKTLLPIIVIIAGVALFVGGLALPRYHNQQEYEQRYRALLGPNRSNDFHELRKQSLTSSFKIQDYGLSVVAIGALLFAAVRWRQIAPHLPKGKFTVLLLGALAAFVAVIAQVGALMLEYSRGEFPHWADSLGIPLAGMPVLFFALLFWAGLHVLMVREKTGATWRLTLRLLNGWLAFLIAATAAIFGWSAAVGDFWQLIPAALWIGFYCSIWISRSQAEQGVQSA